MRELNIKIPIPDKLIFTFGESQKISEEEALKHFEDLFQNMINLVVPGIMNKMEDSVKNEWRSIKHNFEGHGKNYNPNNSRVGKMVHW